MESRNGEDPEEESDALRYCCDLGVGTWTCHVNEYGTARGQEEDGGNKKDNELPK